ncbi:MAG: RES domain-containing protein [Nitrospirae bacterium]|nr:RES domain-containing protein [Nitrospirota bacterium]
MAFRSRTHLRVYRIADRRHPIFDGYGALVHGGRWTSPGKRIIHASLTMACAMLEALAHTGIGRFPKNQAWIEIMISAGLRIEEVMGEDVPGWDSPDFRASRRFGDPWAETKRSAILIVPSVVSRTDRNVLINQDHPDFGKIGHTRPKPLVWDKRIERLVKA